MRTEQIETVIVGGGPAGLRAGAELAGRGIQVAVLDREAETGGIPRHSAHPGYGMRDLGRFLSGPAYARTLTHRARAAGAELRTSNAVTGWQGNLLEVTSPQGRYRIDATSIVLATGARERPRPARRIPGDRGAGIYTTGQLQNIVHLHHASVGQRAVIVGAEAVSWSAALTLKESGCATVMLTTTYPSPDSYAAFSFPGRPFFGTRVATSTRVVRVIGKPRVTGVEIENTLTGAREIVECDTVIFTGDWIADHELARLRGLDMDPATTGPRVDGALRTSVPGVFAAGNLLHPVDTADCAALDGAHVAGSVAAFLRGEAIPDASVDLIVEPPFRWIAPSILRRGDALPPRGKLLLWTDEYVRTPMVVARQDGVVIGRKRMPWPAAPGRVFRVPVSLLRGMRPGLPVSVGLDR